MNGAVCPCEIPMEVSGSLVPSCGGKIESGEGAKVVSDAVSTAPSNPAVPVPVNAHDAGCVVLSFKPIPVVLGPGGEAKVCDPVVCAVPVDMVDETRGPFAIMDSPRDSMGNQSAEVQHSAALVAKSVVGDERGFAGVESIPDGTCSHRVCCALKMVWRSGFPPEKTSVGVVFDQLTQQLWRGKWLLSHPRSPLSGYGQERVGVSAPLAPSFLQHSQQNGRDSTCLPQ